MAILTNLKKRAKTAAKVVAFSAGLISCAHSNPSTESPARTSYDQRFKTQFDSLARATSEINELVSKKDELKTVHYEIRVQFTTNPNEHYVIKSEGERPRLEYTYPFVQLAGNILAEKTGRSYTDMKKTSPTRWDPALGVMVANELKPLHSEVKIEGAPLRDYTPLSALGDLLIRGYRASRGMKLVLPQEDAKLAQNSMFSHKKAYAATFEDFPKNQNILGPKEQGALIRIHPTPDYIICVLMHRGMTKTRNPKYQPLTKLHSDTAEKIEKIVEKAITTRD